MPLDKSEEPFELTGHTGPILKIDISVKGLLASSSGDGTVRIWRLNDKKEVRCFDGFEKVKSFFAAKFFGRVILILSVCYDNLFLQYLLRSSPPKAMRSPIFLTMRFYWLTRILGTPSLR